MFKVTGFCAIAGFTLGCATNGMFWSMNPQQIAVFALLTLVCAIGFTYKTVGCSLTNVSVAAGAILVMVVLTQSSLVQDSLNTAHSSIIELGLKNGIVTVAKD